MATRTVSVELVADIGRYQSGVTKAAVATRGLGDSASTAGSKAQRGFDMAGRGAALLGGVLAGAVAVGLKRTIDLASNAEQSIGGVEAVFKDYAKGVIADSQAADRALGLSANSYRELATVIGSQLKNAGVPISELAAQTDGLITMGADLAAMFGGTTEEAVRALSSALKGEMDPIEAYGISLNDAALKAEAAALGLEVLGGVLTTQQRTMAVMSLVTKQGADAVGAFGRESDTAAGRAARAAAQWENLQTAIGDKLLPAWSALMDFIGTSVIPGLETVGGAIATVGGFMADNTGLALALGAALAVQLAGGITAVTLAFNRMVFTPIVLGLSNMLGVLLGLPGALATAGAAVGGFLIAVAPLIAVGAVVYAISKFVDFATAAGDAREEVAGMWDAVDDARGTAQLDALAGVVDQIRDKIRLLNGEIGDVPGTGFEDLFALPEFGAMHGDDLAALEEYEKQLRRAEQAQRDANITASTLAAQWGVSTEQVLALADKYGVDLTAGAATATSALYGARAAAQVEGEASSSAAIETEFYAEQLQGAADAASEAKKQTDLFKMSLDILTGAHVSMIEAESALQASLAEATGAMEGLDGAVLQTNGQLNLQSEAGRAAAGVLLGVRDSGNQLIATMIEQGATSEEVRAKDAQLREGFINTAMQMGISRQAAENLANQILGIPEERRTKIDADTAAASSAVSDFQRQVDNLHGKTVDIQANWANGGTLNGSMRFDFADGGILKFFADGGHENHVAQHAPAGAMRVWAEPETGGESYIPHAASKRKRSHQIWAETGRMLNFFADGGIQSNPNICADFSPVAAFARQAAADIRKLLEPATGMVGALNWVKSQVGKPYIWGGVGPAGWDCSGLQSSITNIIRGYSPYSRVGSTATFPWPGFVSGYGSYTIGSTSNAGGGIGHMAGTLLGVNVESSGKAGVRVGSSALGASSALFNTQAHLAMAGGGLITEPVFGFGASGRSYSFGERGPETVMPGIRSRESSGMSGGGAGGRVNVNLTNAVVTGSFVMDREGVVRLVDGRIQQREDQINRDDRSEHR